MGKYLLTKRFAREHSLFYCENWSYSELYYTSRILGYQMKNLFYIFEPGSSQVSSWYDFSELAKLFKLVVKKSKDPKFFEWVEKDFKRLWKKIEPYVLKKKGVKNIKELKRFKKDVIDFYGPYIAVYVSPEIKELEKKYRDTSLKLRGVVQEIINDIDDVYLEFFVKKYPQYKDIAYHLLSEEIFSLERTEFSKKKFEEFKKRKGHGCFLYNNKLYQYSELKKILDENNITLSGGVQVTDKKLKGQIAKRGIVKGKVKIVLGVDDLFKIGEGDILVAPMTMPKYLPAMKKAAAFVTDEGGITCHAAIIAREMKKPCIIGTKIATQVLKDGDLVEVDANKGIVKILKRPAEEKQLIDPGDWQYEFQQRNDNPVIMSDIWTRSVHAEIEKEMKLPIGNLDYLFTASGKGYVKKKQKENIIEKLKEATKKDEYFQYIYDATKKRMLDLEKASRYLLKQIDDKSLNGERLAALWEDFDKKFLQIIPWFFIPWYVTEENILSDRVKNRLEKYKEKIKSITDFPNALAMLIFPTREALFQKEQELFVELVKLAEKKKAFKTDKIYLKQAKKHLNEFSWTTTYIFVPLEKMTLNELNGRVLQALKDKFTEQYALQKKSKEKNKKLAQKIIAMIKSDKRLMKDIEWAREYAWLLTWSVEQAFISLANLIPFCKFLARKLGVSYKEWPLFTSKEITGTLRGNLKLTKSKLVKRQKAHVMLMENGKQTLLVGEQARKISNWIDENVGKITGVVGTIAGQSAYPGKVEGKVYVANKSADALKMPEGSVLVSPMTTPDYVPAMKKAAAIITDEGGLLSHAAIISRELGKPCIVGTKIATQVLKDGDLVEVNANKGIIKVIK